MRRARRALGLFSMVAALSTETARAQTGTYYPPPPGYAEAPPEVPERLSAVRLEFGGAAVSRGVYCAYGYYTTGCSSLEYPYAPLNFSAEIEKGLGRLLGLSLGVHYLTGPYNDRNVEIWEPTADVVLRFGSYHAGSSFRIRFGIGWWIGENSKYGFAGRSGIGFTIRGRSPLGLALDAAWEYGSFDGKTASVVHYQLGPEFSF